MTERRRPAAKTAILLAPLAALVLTLHAWGDDLGGGFGRWLGRLHYPERVVGPFAVRAPRRSRDADAFAARTLEASLRAMLDAQGARLGLAAPALPIRVLLLESELDAERAGLPGKEMKEDVEWVDPARRVLAVRLGKGGLQEREVAAALRRGLARILIHDASPSGLSPWLREGAAGLLESARPADLVGSEDELPHVRALLAAHEPDFRGVGGAAFRRGARLLAAYLLEKDPDAFLAYYRSEQAGGALPESAFVSRLGDPVHADTYWREWRQSLK